jgi:hypothetical protein
MSAALNFNLTLAKTAVLMYVRRYVCSSQLLANFTRANQGLTIRVAALGSHFRAMQSFRDLP